MGLLKFFDRFPHKPQAVEGVPENPNGITIEYIIDEVVVYIEDMDEVVVYVEGD